MSIYMYEAVSGRPSFPFEREKEETLLATIVSDLAVLRFSIVVTAKWEVAESEDAERRTELRNELASLRLLYFEKIDQIAIKFGVERAMKAKEEVEGTFKSARDIKRTATPSDAGQLYF